MAWLMACSAEGKLSPGRITTTEEQKAPCFGKLHMEEGKQRTSCRHSHVLAGAMEHHAGHFPLALSFLQQNSQSLACGGPTGCWQWTHFLHATCAREEMPGSVLR